MNHHKGETIWRKKDNKIYEIWSVNDKDFTLRWTNSKGNSELITVSEKELNSKYWNGENEVG